MGCGASANHIQEPTRREPLLTLTQKDVQKWVNSLPEHLQREINRLELLPCSGKLLNKWDAGFLKDAGISSTITIEQILDCKETLASRLQEGETITDICISSKAEGHVQGPSNELNGDQIQVIRDDQLTKVVTPVEEKAKGKVGQLFEKPVEKVEDLVPFSKKDWSQIGSEMLPKVISFLHVIKSSVPPPGDTGVGILISITKVAQKAVCNHKNIKSLHTRLLDLAHLLGSNSKEMKSRNQNVRKVLNKFHEATKSAEAYFRSYAGRHWIQNVMNTFADEERYKKINQHITDAVKELKLVFTVDVQKNVEVVLGQLEVVVGYVDSNRKLCNKIQELGGAEALASSPDNLTKLLKEMPESEQRLALAMQAQVISLLKEMASKGPFSFIQQPDLRTFWATAFPVERKALWTEFWPYFDEGLKDIIPPDEFEAVMQLVGPQSAAREKLQEGLKGDGDGSTVSVLDIKVKISPNTPLVEALRETLWLIDRVVPSIPGCAPLPMQEGELVGRYEDVKKVTDLLLGLATSSPDAPAASTLCGVRGCLLLAPGGLGKSRLAVAVASRLHAKGHLKGGGGIFLDLRNACKMENVAGRMCSALNMKSEGKDASLHASVSSSVNQLRNLSARGTVLLLVDNAEDALRDEKSAELLHEFLKQLQTISTGRVLLLITSRVPFPWGDELSGISSYDVTALESDQATILVSTMLPDLPAEEIQIVVDSCNGVPLTIMMAAKALDSGRISITDMKNTCLASDGAFFLSLVLSTLPSDQLNTMLALSVFPSSFFAEDAAAVLESQAIENVTLQLNELIHHSLLNVNQNQNNFFLHPLVRSTVTGMASEAAEQKEIVQHAKEHFVLKVLDYVNTCHTLAKEGAEGVKMALSLARSRMADIEETLSLLMTQAEWTADIWERATIQLGKSAAFLQLSGLNLKDSVLHVASKLVCHWNETRNGSSVDVRAVPLSEELSAWASSLKAECLYARGHYFEAAKLYEMTLEVQMRTFGQEHPDTLSSMNDLASCMSNLGDYAGARELYEKTLETRRRVLGEEHPDVLDSMNNLADCMCDLGDYAGARKLSEKTLEIQRRVLGEEHPDVLFTMNNLADYIRHQGDYASARELHEEGLEIQRRVLGEEHPDVLSSMDNLAGCIRLQGDYARARELHEKVLEKQRQVLGEEHPDVLKSMDNLASCISDLGDYASARELHEKTLEIRRRVLGKEHPDVLSLMNNLASCMYNQGDYVSARELLEKTLETQRRVLGEEHPDVLSSMSSLAKCMGN